MDIYVRLKRDKTTIFLSCNTHEKVKKLVKAVSELVGVKEDDIKLLKDVEKKEQASEEETEDDAGPNRIELDVDKSIKSYGLPNTSIVYYVYRKGEDDWEDVKIVDEGESKK
mmetsp:Transcript_12631/g.24157  ORF Transcript_12631/g.24157 Transcript_12631/m.24157 type:complete len:112 (-) Transcript_12631:237-572(-)